MCNNTFMTASTLHIENEAAMEAAAARLAPLLKKGDVVCLQGDLGAGKTVFARALVNALSPTAEEVPSPTFTLAQVYELPQLTLWHFDLYRIEKQEDIRELGWDEARRGGVCVVEWPERLGSFLPKDRLEISLSFIKESEQARLLTFMPFGAWEARLQKG